MEEVWKPVLGYEGFYEISSFGRIKNSKGKILNETNCGGGDARGIGYRGKVLYKNGRHTLKHFRVHTLVLEAFVCKRPEGMQAAHLNGDPSDNRLKNLKWVTPKQNVAHQKLHGTHRSGSKIYGAKLNESQVLEIKKILKNKMKRYRPYLFEIGKKFGVSREIIQKIRLGATWRNL